MHTSQKKSAAFIHNGDCSGDVIIVPKGDEVQAIIGTQVEVPFQDLYAIVTFDITDGESTAQYVLSEDKVRLYITTKDSIWVLWEDVRSFVAYEFVQTRLVSAIEQMEVDALLEMELLWPWQDGTHPYAQAKELLLRGGKVLGGQTII